MPTALDGRSARDMPESIKKTLVCSYANDVNVLNQHGGKWGFVSCGIDRKKGVVIYCLVVFRTGHTFNDKPQSPDMKRA